MNSKVCTKCRIEKAVSEFFNRRLKSGNISKNSHCSSCTKVARDLWAASNKAALIGYSKKYYDKKMSIEENRNKEAARHREARKKDPHRYRETTKKYRQLSPEKQAAKLAKRRAAKLQRTPLWLTKAQYEEIADIYRQAKELEAIFFNRKFHVDHIIPLQGKDVCGLHVPWNLQILTAEENIAKSNKHG